jgi:hypothetical protein
MKDKPMTKVVAKRFLLGIVNDSERQQIESLLIVDPEAEETILIAEDELVEDYLEGSLSESDRARFLEQYAYGPRERRRLRIARSIREYALEAELRRPSGSTALQKLQQFVSWRWLTERRLYVPVAMAVATLLIVTVIWLVKWNNQRIRENNQHLAIETELRELNSPSSLRENPPEMLSLVIPSVSLRSVNPPAEITTQTANRVIELQLLWPQKEEFESYVATLRRVGGTEEFTIANLHAEQKSGGRVVRLRLPAQSLMPGLYHASLSAIASDGTRGSAEEYDFIISN